MISLDNRPVEVVEPTSPPSSAKEHSPPPSPEIRVTDSPMPGRQSASPAPKSPQLQSSTLSHSPTALFQPFLQAPAASSSPPSSPPDPIRRGPLPFSIDNILKPTFGQRLFLHSVAAAAAAAAAAVHQQNAAAASAAAAVSTATPSPKSVSSPSPPLLSSSSSTSLAAAQTPNSTQPVDLSSKSSSSAAGSKKEELPPGMVRGPNGQLWPAWVFCTRYSDRPSSGPRARKIKKRDRASGAQNPDEKRPRTAFSSEQLARLRKEFEDNRYLNEDRRRNLANDLGLNETQIKIWFQNKRAKLKKSSGEKGDLAKMLAAQGLYNHATMAVDEDEYPNL